MASDPTFTRCPLCRGSLRLDNNGSSVPCLCTRSTSPGYAETGLTMGQIERMVHVERCLAGDPGVPVDERSRVIVALRGRVDRAEARLAEATK